MDFTDGMELHRRTLLKGLVGVACVAAVLMKVCPDVSLQNGKIFRDYNALLKSCNALDFACL